MSEAQRWCPECGTAYPAEIVACKRCMAVLVDESTRLVVQGLTGTEGRFHGLRNRAYGTNVVAGVTPGKEGQDVEGIPVFDTVERAIAAGGHADDLKEGLAVAQEALDSGAAAERLERLISFSQEAVPA